MLRKINTKTIVMLAIAIILLVSVCFSAVYAWFYTNTFANAGISGEILNFYFTADGKFDGELDFTNAGGESTLVYSFEPNGMFPGQKVSATIELSNEQSSLDAIYRITINNTDKNHYPKDCIMKITDAEDTSVVYYNSTFEAEDLVFPAEGTDHGNLYGNGYVQMPAGESRKLTISFEWPYSFEDIPADIAVDYADADAKNAGDLEYLKSSKNAAGEIIEAFFVSFKIEAQQIPEPVE